jgi:hypothetical protein
VRKFRNRAFRVNAFKDFDGVWKEFPTGRVIDFSNFPDFVPAWEQSHKTFYIRNLRIFVLT